MQIGILGFPQSGKKTLYSLLTQSQKAPADSRPVKGVSFLKDERLDFLSGIYNPQKIDPAKIEVVLLEDAQKESLRQGKLFKDILLMDALVFVVRAFENESVYHTEGTVDALRDIRILQEELIMHDLIFIEKRLERIKLAKKKGEKQQDDSALLEKLRESLDKEVPLRRLSLDKDEERQTLTYPFLTKKATVILLNCSQQKLKDEEFLNKARENFKDDQFHFVRADLKIEEEIASLESKQEREEFLKSEGIEKSCLETLSRACLEALGMISFFSASKRIITQWIIPRGSTALEAAGAIHSDLARGFIRAEIINFKDIAELKSESAVAAAGKMMVKGKDYVVLDADIISVRFNV